MGGSTRFPYHFLYGSKDGSKHIIEVSQDSYMGEPLYVRIKRNVSREELAIIENRILERDMAAKRRAEKLAKNIAVTFFTFHVSISNLSFAKQSVRK